MTYSELIAYYANLLILQYRGKIKAYGNISTVVAPVIMGQFENTFQRITFDPIPGSGTFTISYGPESTDPIDTFATNAEILSALQNIIPQWSISDTYSVGDLVQLNLDTVYISLSNGNIGNSVTDDDNWAIYGTYTAFSVEGGIPLGYLDITLLNTGPATLFTITDNDLDSGEYLETEEGDQLLTETGDDIITE